MTSFLSHLRSLRDQVILLDMGKSAFSGDAAMIALFNRLLDGEILTAKKIASHLGINDAAARKKLAALLELPCAIREPGRPTAVKFATLLPRDAVSGTDVAASCLVSSFASALRNTELLAPARKLVDRFVQGSRSYRDVKDLDRKFWYVVRGGESALPDNSAGLLEIVEALLRNKRISFEYEHSDGMREGLNRRPLTLAAHDHQLYVVCWLDRPTGAGHQFYPYRFSRMARIKEGQKFNYPVRATYDPSVLFQNTFGIFIANDSGIEHIRLRMNSFWARYSLTHRWHDTQKRFDEADGSAVISLDVRICHEFKRWLLWFGGDVEVLDPAHLRDWVATQHASAAGIYGARKPGVRSARANGARSGRHTGNAKRSRTSGR